MLGDTAAYSVNFQTPAALSAFERLWDLEMLGRASAGQRFLCALSPPGFISKTIATSGPILHPSESDEGVGRTVINSYKNGLLSETWDLLMNSDITMTSGNQDSIYMEKVPLIYLLKTFKVISEVTC